MMSQNECSKGIEEEKQCKGDVKCERRLKQQLKPSAIRNEQCKATVILIVSFSSGSGNGNDASFLVPRRSLLTS